MATNKIVATTVNKIGFEIENSSYKKAVEKIRSIGREFKKMGDSANPMGKWQATAMKTQQTIQKVARQQSQVNAKLHRESVAQAKKEAAVRAAIEKRESARRKQAVGNLTAKNPEMARMKKFYQQQAREAKKASRSAPSYGGYTAPKARVLAGAKRFQYVPGNPNMGGVASDPSLVKAQTAAMNRYHRQMRRGGSSPGVDNAMMADRAARRTHLYNSAIRLSAKYGAGFRGKLSGYSELESRFARGEMQKSTFNAHLSALQSGLKSAASQSLTLGDAFRDLRRSVINATAAYTAFSAFTAVNRSGHMMEGASAALTAVTGDPNKANSEVSFVQKEAMRLGFDLKSGLQGYSQMAVNAKNQMTNQEVHELFSAYSQYAAAYGADEVKYQRGIMAIQQMLGKGQVMSEELKQQLAEALPGAYEPFIKATKEAFGLSELSMDQFMDMMKKGEVKTAKIMKYVAKYMNEASAAGYERMQKSNVLAENRLKTFMELTRQKLFTRWADELTEFYYTLIRVGENMQPLLDFGGDFAAGMIRAFNDVIATINNFIEKFYGYYLEFLVYIGAWDGKTARFSKTADEAFSTAKWGGYAIGILAVASAIGKVYRLLRMVLGVGVAIKAAGGIGGMIGSAGGAAAGGAAAGGAAALAKKGLLSRLLGGLWKYKGPLALAYMGYEGAGLLDDYWQSSENQKTSGQKHPQWMVDMVNGASNFLGLDYRLDPGMYTTPPKPGTLYNPLDQRLLEPVKFEVGEGKITLSIDDSEFSKIIDAKLEWESLKDINFMSTDLQY
ncbi:tape measure protein [Escherichia coli]|nr:tape measure protein [Escherichia coli]EMB7054285.1 tape measure protein [Escherichia coli]